MNNKAKVDAIAAIWLAKRQFDRNHESTEIPIDFWKYVTYENVSWDQDRNYIVSFAWSPTGTTHGAETFFEVCVNAADGSTRVTKSLPISTYSTIQLVPYRK
jgi:hypothetical protein